MRFLGALKTRCKVAKHPPPARNTQSYLFACQRHTVLSAILRDRDLEWLTRCNRGFVALGDEKKRRTLGEGETMETQRMLGTVNGETGRTEDASAEQRLWIAVLALAVEDWTTGTLRAKREAQRFLFEDKADYYSVCANAGVDGDSFRTRLAKISRRVQMEGAIPYQAAA
jgi:hypothetical protein